MPETPAEHVGPHRESRGTGFPRSARLLKHSSFDLVYRTGQRQFSGNLTVFFLRRAPHSVGPVVNGPRVGLTVSRALGGAVDRNRIKRRMREAVRRSLTRLSAPVDVVINPKRTVLKVEFPALLDEVGRALSAVEKRLGR